MDRNKEEQIKTRGTLDRLLKQLEPVLSGNSKSYICMSLDILIHVLLSQLLPLASSQCSKRL